jgi:membrane protein implicated in regulation of membrane protease activity
MVWTHFYLICFAAGFIFSLLSFLLGSFHFPHFPHSGDVHPGVNSHAAAPSPSHGNGDHGAKGVHVSVLNPITIAAFLTWFGGSGYLLSRYSTVWFLLGIGIAAVVGITGASLIYLFLTRVLISKKENLNSADYEMTGVLGRISVPIREGGTGEIIYSQAGTRRTCGARSEHGAFIPKNSEVIVIRYDKGIAYVRLWSEVTQDDEEKEVEAGF